MSSAEDIFASMNIEEPHIVIGSDRKIIVPDKLKRIAVQFDHNIETVTFDCPRYWDGHDMSTMAVYINYMRSDSKPGSYKADNVRVDETDDTIMHFDWTITRNVSDVKGQLAVLVCVRNVDRDGNEQNHWNSELCKDMYVSEGMKCSESIVDLYPDVITQILTNLNIIEKGTIKELDKVDLITCESGVYLTSKIIYRKSIISQPFTEMVPGKAFLIVVKNEIGIYFQWIGASYILSGLSNAEGEFENEFVKYDFSKFATKDYVNKLIEDIESGEEGKDGKSAYQIALDNGFEGTEEEWLESLNGPDGFSPIAKVEQTDKGAAITITDKNGTTNATVLNGKDGYTPKKGVDYYTEADKAELVQMVIESLGGKPIFGYVDENNNIIVSGNLADGSYSVKYETENETIDIGDLVIGEDEEEIINQLPICVNADKTPFIGANGEKGYKTNTRLSASSGGETTSGATDLETTGYIPIKYNDTVYLKGITLEESASQTMLILFYDSDFTYFTNSGCISATVFGTTNGEVVSAKMNSTNLNNSNITTDVGYIRICAKEINSNSVITVNQPIE